MLRRLINKYKYKRREWLAYVLFALGILCLFFAFVLLLASRSPQNSDQQVVLRESEVLPETTKPRRDEVDNHTVPADSPRLIYIPKINIAARVFSVGLDAQNRIGIPRNVNDAGWYDKSVKPGQPGAVVIDGHVSSQSSRGVFYNLKRLEEGDEIVLERGDRTTIRYTVASTKTYDFDKVDMQAVLTSVHSGKPGLNLITCGGEVINGTHRFDKRLVVFAAAH